MTKTTCDLCGKSTITTPNPMWGGGHYCHECLEECEHCGQTVVADHDLHPMDWVYRVNGHILCQDCSTKAAQAILDAN